ncbi:MAG TPA: F0F1 ATP synthase subunit A [Halomonas sp.]|nr:F0F1 ATP synthase subunit A [Halomonas sp.]
MQFSPDEITVFTLGNWAVSATIVNTWIVMALLVGLSWLVTRNLRADVPPNRLRTALETIVQLIQGQIEEITQNSARHVLYFAGTLFLFIALSNLLLIVPGFSPPTSSLSTTAALALSVLVAVPVFGIAKGGVKNYLRTFIEPSIIMLPFNIIGEFSRGISLAVRLYGNVMSGAVIAAILLTVAPFIFPVVMDMLGLLTGMIQAYIFAILATVYISSATAEPEPSATPREPSATPREPSATPREPSAAAEKPSAAHKESSALPGQPPTSFNSEDKS